MSALFSTDISARLGTLNKPPLLPLPALPNIVSEWASLIPLVCHLSGSRDDYHTAGDVALLGRVSLGLFPKLGALAGVARLLERTPAFLDQASTRGGSGAVVWDVRWGSAFPAANGAAADVVARYVRRRAGTGREAVVIPEALPPRPEPPGRGRDGGASDGSEGSGASSATAVGGGGEDVGEPGMAGTEKLVPAPQTQFRRFQTLHVYSFGRRVRSSRSVGKRIEEWRLSGCGRVLSFLLLVAIAVVLGLCGAYGTSAIIVCSAISRLALQSINIQRPPGYLQNNETHDACMLVATHQNAVEWHLYIGDRGVVDSLLNKAMFMVPNQPSMNLELTTWWLRFANALQLLGMTYVAAQKGWDGVCLVVLLALNWLLRRSFRAAGLASRWLTEEGVEVEVKSFKFTGRMAMLGAIQVFSGTKVTRWMDDIIVPHPRREAWLRRINGLEIGTDDSLTSHDLSFVEKSYRISVAGANFLKEELNKKDV